MSGANTAAVYQHTIQNSTRTEVESPQPIQKVKGVKINLESCRWIWPQTLELAVHIFKMLENILNSNF